MASIQRKPTTPRETSGQLQKLSGPYHDRANAGEYSAITNEQQIHESFVNSDSMPGKVGVWL